MIRGDTIQPAPLASEPLRNPERGWIIAAAAPAPSDEAIRAALDRVLTRPEFGSSPGVDPLQQLLQALSRLFGWLGGLQKSQPVLYWTLLIGLTALLAFLLYHIAITVRRILTAGAAVGDVARRAERERLSLGYWQEAQRRAEQGDFTEAIRHLFLSLVYHFDESGRVQFAQAATNHEYLSLFADRPAVQAELAVFVQTLDDHWYGQQPTDEQHYRQCRDLYEALK